SAWPGSSTTRRPIADRGRRCATCSTRRWAACSFLLHEEGSNPSPARVAWQPRGSRNSVKTDFKFAGQRSACGQSARSTSLREEIEPRAQLMFRRSAKNERRGHRVLQRDAGTVEHRDLVVALAPGLLGRDDRAEVAVDRFPCHRALLD